MNNCKPQAISRKRYAGFTLIEIMVVVFVIGISVGVASLVVSRGGPEKELRKIAERFATLASFASERAILSNTPVGLLLEPPAWRKKLDENLQSAWRYRWQRIGRGGWEDEPGLEAVELPPTVRLDVTVGGQLWEWQEAPKVKLPMAVFYPSGEVTMFAIEFRDERIPDFSQHVEVNAWGEVEWLEGARRAGEADNAF